MKSLTYRILRLWGWEFAGALPRVPKMIVVGAPHTSNWDFFVFLAALHHFRVSPRFLAKEGLFRWPLAPILRKLGGIPVSSGSTGVVEQVVAEFEASEEMVLVLAPEGSRGAGRWWRSGFVRMAELASVPVVLAGLDYARRTLTVGEAFDIEGDISGFMGRARAFYADKRGLRPDLETPVALREETAGS